MNHVAVKKIWIDWRTGTRESVYLSVKGECEGVQVLRVC